MQIKKPWMFAFAVALMALGWAAYMHVSTSRRHAAYQNRLIPLQRDLQPGTPEDEILEYLRTRNIAYHVDQNNKATRLMIEIGEEPVYLVCEGNVYIALEFGSADTLNRVYLTRIDTCL